MPLFRFHCRSCQEDFELFLTLGEVRRGVAVCPHCQSGEVETSSNGQGGSRAGASASACSLSKRS